MRSEQGLTCPIDELPCRECAAGGLCEVEQLLMAEAPVAMPVLWQDEGDQA